ncbi:MAG: MOSC domain-containing protein, partial [Bacteroidota bacterium]
MARDTLGSVVSLHICPGHRKPMVPVASVEVVAGVGLLGDLHALEHSSRQVLLVEKETLDALNLLPGMVKENITT